MATIGVASAGSPARITKSRRNGKLYSCEPCRRHKLKCDHTLPVCGRCVRRKKPEACVYHPAPLTKIYNADDSILSTDEPPTDGPEHHSQLPPIASIQSPDPVVPWTAPVKGAPYSERKIGFLGPTSFFSAFDDDHHPSFVTTRDMVGKEPSEPVLEAKVSSGTEVLSLLVQHGPLLHKLLVRKYLTLHCGILHEPTFRAWIDDVFAMKETLVSSSPESLRAWSRSIWQNTSSVVRIGPQTTMREWTRSCSGPNLRWEIIGLIFTMAGLCTHDAEDWPEQFQDLPGHAYVERAVFLDHLFRAAEACLRFCSECDVVNETYIIFQLKHIVLVEDLYGDAHSISWRRVGDILSTLMVAGMHRPDKLSVNAPIWLRELRRRIIVNAYGRDQNQSLFFGRPPRLSYTYCNLEPPLELAEDELLLEGPELDRALASLDEHGWSTARRPGVTISYHLRLSVRISRLREDISKLVLGVDDMAALSSSIDDMTKRINEVYAYMEAADRRISNLSHDDLAKQSTSYNYEATKDDIARLTRSHLLTSTIHSELLFVKALVNRGLRPAGDLIPLAVKLLQHTIRKLGDSAAYKNYKSELSYMLLTYGLPAAGMIALELLRQQRSGIPSSDPTFSRSEVIQNLSVFVAGLGAIEPRQGNFAVCDQGRKLLRSILDQILNGPPLAVAASASADAATTAAAPVDESHDVAWLNDAELLQLSTENEVDFWQWLESSEWIKDL